MTTLWYLDGFHYGAVLGDKFPVNSYGPATLDDLAYLMTRLANSFHRIELSHETKGQMPLHPNDWLSDWRPPIRTPADAVEFVRQLAGYPDESITYAALENAVNALEAAIAATPVAEPARKLVDLNEINWYAVAEAVNKWERVTFCDTTMHPSNLREMGEVMQKSVEEYCHEAD